MHQEDGLYDDEADFRRVVANRDLGKKMISKRCWPVIRERRGVCLHCRATLKQMNLPMTTAFSSISMLAGGALTGSEVKWFLLAAGAVMLVGICWQMIDTLIARFYGRKWPTLQGVIDVVSVAFIEDDGIPSPKAGLDSSHYKATLTYTYNNPDHQIGDYSRDFGDKDEAEAWANSYKGEPVKVHVDPRDPARSVLREEDL